MSNLREKYNKELRATLKEELGLNNIMAVPKVTKVVINMGVGEAANDKKHLESALENLTVISGQKPIITKAKKDISNFKIRKGWPVGCKVTLRSNMMFEFLERLMVDKEKMVNPYFTTKTKGTGLGLAIVTKIINDHNSLIAFNSTKDGAKIVITLPKKYE